MNSPHSPKSLSPQTIILHWVTGLLFLTVFCIGYSFDFIPKGPEKMQLMGFHKSLGTIVLIVAALRISWRFKEGIVKPISELPNWQRKMAIGSHHLLLLFTLLMPTSGIMMSIGGGRGLNVFGLNIVASGDKIETLASIGGAIHGFSVTFILIILLLHIGAAFKHQFIDKDGTLSRMLGRKL